MLSQAVRLAGRVCVPVRPLVPSLPSSRVSLWAAAPSRALGTTPEEIKVEDRLRATLTATYVQAEDVSGMCVACVCVYVWMLGEVSEIPVLGRHGGRFANRCAVRGSSV